MALLRALPWFSALILVAGHLRASQDYPDVIRDKLMIRTPGCTLCHADLNGGTGTVVRPFGLSMQAFQARGQDPASLRQAIDQDEAAACDSDGDGTPDITELRAGTDPNDGPGGTCGGIPPERGCAIAGPLGNARERWYLVVAAAWLPLLLRRFRHRYRGRRRSTGRAIKTAIV